MRVACQQGYAPSAPANFPMLSLYRFMGTSTQMFDATTTVYSSPCAHVCPVSILNTHVYLVKGQKVCLERFLDATRPAFHSATPPTASSVCCTGNLTKHASSTA
jgi:hypothetical protein